MKNIYLLYVDDRYQGLPDIICDRDNLLNNNISYSSSGKYGCVHVTLVFFPFTATVHGSLKDK